jgi:hypothetical protein
MTSAGQVSDVGLCLAEPVGRPCPWRSEPREALGEDAAGAVELWANEAADGDLEPHGPAETGQVIEPAGVPAVHAVGVGAAQGQAAVVAVVARWTVRLSISRQALTRRLPSGAPRNSSGSNTRLREVVQDALRW